MSHRHFCIDVEGWFNRMARLKPRQREHEAGAWKNDDGTRPSYQQVQIFMHNHRTAGHVVIPMGKCDDFDWQTGCRGHEEGEGEFPIVGSSAPVPDSNGSTGGSQP